MKAAAITGPGTIVIRDQEAPQARGGRDLVVVKILVSPLCTEFKSRRAGHLSDELGHEAAGVVVDAASSQLVSEGDRVVVMPQFACGRCWLCLRGEHIHCPNQRDPLAESGSSHGRGTIAQYVIKPDWLLIKVPDDISLEHASMACCGFGPTFTAHQRLGTSALDSAAVSGCGPVGLGAVIQGVTRGAEVIALETQSYRSALAAKLGASHVFDPRESGVPEQIASLTQGRGASVGIETSGAPTAARLLADAIRTRGRMAIVAWTPEVVLPAIVPAGLEVHGCWHWNHQHFLQDMWTMIRKSGPAIDLMITHRMSLDDVARAMDLQDRGECGKIVLYPFGSEAVDAA
ncbi:L-threonine 3-dehydrogenase [Microlunatus panaciterrae]|uniref:Threonine dehydrogenase-like Zn-dependent dehydrogenase n=1 Tax=Microlunatus panaciterrae TaxID=400768 RepID=A0ABS2RKC9_9ACTN|nr:zinc-binding dehydrogenase [Microlunatus panaciterrae]MBM7799469.1 threonine dehydrogenase-like Zn-dependent dehydrogenase [Microlunatus panaciterrae]